jgi:hypothetical protein
MPQHMTERYFQESGKHTAVLLINIEARQNNANTVVNGFTAYYEFTATTNLFVSGQELSCFDTVEGSGAVG